MSDTQTYVMPDSCNDFAKYALMNNNGMNNWGNNPFFYLIWMYMMRYLNYGQGDDATQRQIQTVQDTIQTNHNSDLLLSAINGNESSVREFSATTGLNFSDVQNAICGVKSAIAQVGAQLGYSSEKVINAISSGDCGIIQAVKDTSCGTQQSILKMGYENQLANERQTTALNSNFASLSSLLSQNFNTLAYNTAQQTCTLQNTIKDSSNTSTSQILAKLDAIEDARKDREISSLTAELTAANARAERQSELAPIIAQINEIRRSQPSTTTIPYPQLTALPTAQVYGLYNTTGYWG